MKKTVKTIQGFPKKDLEIINSMGLKQVKGGAQDSSNNIVSTDIDGF